MHKYMVIFHATTRSPTDEQWTMFVQMLRRGNHLMSGSALAKPIDLQKAGDQCHGNAFDCGYMIIVAKNINQVKNLMKSSPTHVHDGLVEVFPLL